MLHWIIYCVPLSSMCTRHLSFPKSIDYSIPWRSRMAKNLHFTVVSLRYHTYGKNLHFTAHGTHKDYCPNAKSWKHILLADIFVISADVVPVSQAYGP